MKLAGQIVRPVLFWGGVRKTTEYPCTDLVYWVENIKF